MATNTTKLGYIKPSVGDPVDADLWGGQWNTNADQLDVQLPNVTQDKTATFSVVAADFNNLFLVDTSAGAVVANLPAVGDVFAGYTVYFKVTDAANTFTIDPDGIEEIDGVTTVTTRTFAKVTCDGTSWSSIIADITTEANVIEALDGATIPTATVAPTDKILGQDVDDSGNLKTYTAQSIADFAGGEFHGFQAYLGSDQSIATATNTKVAFNTESFDPDSDYDTTLFRYTPSNPGKYDVTVFLEMITNTDQATVQIMIYKNGTRVEEAVLVSSGTAGIYGTISTTLEMNGTTDHTEIFVAQGTGSNKNISGSVPRRSKFRAHLIG
jgi:hypothetical protein